jgi:hypothetical protein
MLRIPDAHALFVISPSFCRLGPVGGGEATTKLMPEIEMRPELNFLPHTALDKGAAGP